jgi:uncharacterized membrane protein
VDSAGAALTVVASLFRTDKTQSFTQHVQQGCSGINVDCGWLTIDAAS